MKQFIATDTSGHKMIIHSETLKEAESIAEEHIGESLYSVVSKKIVNDLTKGGMSNNDIEAIKNLLVSQENI